MSYDPLCARCMAVAGTCMDCGACFQRHCECPVCQHGHPRAEINDCVFCRPAILEELAEVEVAEAIDRITFAQQEQLDEGAADEGDPD